MDIIEFLIADHRKVEDLFARHELGEDTSSAIAAALTNHDNIETHLLYPAIERDLPDLHEELEHAREEHDVIRSRIEDVIRSAAAHDMQAKTQAVVSLRECVEHHVKEEESSMFPAVAELLDPDLLERMGVLASESKF
jgi:uncharacterized protein (UPF0335 family)